MYGDIILNVIVGNYQDYISFDGILSMFRLDLKTSKQFI